MSEEISPADWVGERVRTRMENDEEVQGTLQGVTEHGVIINRRGQREEGTCFHSWKIVRRRRWKRPRGSSDARCTIPWGSPSGPREPRRAP